MPALPAKPELVNAFATKAEDGRAVQLFKENRRVSPPDEIFQSRLIGGKQGCVDASMDLFAPLGRST
jgi:hypothetical protein